MIGQIISHYKILEKLGEGGMGVVYKAQDTKLDRTVALKFLPQQLSPTEEDRARFVQEAKSAAALNHPNICTIHGIEEHETQTFIVMEYVEGQTLREKLAAGSLPIKDVVSYGIQIGEAVQEAHAHGVVHRDIKADNVMVNTKNQIKVMDFGLAKLKGSLKLTRATTTVGTLGYMSPEQIQGSEADFRSDIFSFGVLLYEMLTGHLPFRGEHEAAIMYSIVNQEPEPLVKYRSEAPDQFHHIILGCLEKNPEDRYQHAEEVVRELRRLQKQSSRAFKTMNPGLLDAPSAAGADSTLPHPQRMRIQPMWIALGALGLITVIMTLLLMRKNESAGTINAEIKITKFTSLPGLEDEPSWSPDGKFLAYTADDRGNFDVLVRPVEGGKVIRIADSDADDAEPAWSPDGSKIAFVSARDRGGTFSPLFGAGLLETYLKGRGGDIFLVPALGGRAVKLVTNGFDPAWSPDGKTIVYRSNRGGQWDLWTIPAGGGTPKQLTNDPQIDYQPSWSPDGRWVVYGSPNAVSVVPTAGGPSKVLTVDRSMVVKPTWSPDGKFVLFSSNRNGSMNLWKMPFTPDEDKPATPVRITVGEGDDVNISAAASGNAIAFATATISADIWELTLGSGKLRQVSFETTQEDHPVLSPDGKTLLVESGRTGTRQLWTMDLDGTFLTQVTSEPNLSDESPLGCWSPDGKEIAYDHSGSVVIRSLGEISPRAVIDSAALPYWSPDGRRLVFIRTDTAGQHMEIWTHALDSGEEKQLTSLESGCSFPSWSPDGRWIAFNVNTRNTRQIWVVPASGGNPRMIVASEDNEYSHPMWSPLDKDVLLCLRNHKDIVQVSAATGKVQDLHRFTEAGVNLIDYPTFSPDGQKVYFTLFKKTGDVYTLENY